MAITSLLFHSPKPFQHSKPIHNPNRKSFLAKPPTCILKPNNKTSSPCEDHKLQWKEELKIAHGSDRNLENIDKDDAFFQECIDRRAVDNVRMLIVDAVQNAKTGHPGMALGMAEVGYHLYRHVMRYNPKNPKWFNRDRFVLSAGHGCLLQMISVEFDIEDLKQLCKLGSRTPGHPENTITDGIEVTTGPLGQGVANAVGLALAEAHLSARFNKPDAVVVDHRTFCIMGDGCAMEGISNEAASLAAHWKLNKLVVIYDDNKNTIDGATTLAFSEDVSARFKALGWNTINVENETSNPALSPLPGEDGPTHQPVEHLCGLRAIPRMLVFRPADGNETAGAYRVAIRNREAPSVIALSRQKVLANLEGTSSDGVEAGGYIVSDNSGDGGLPEIILIGTGSELCLCEASAEELRNEGRGVRVVSLVCWRLFDAQSKEYKEYVLPRNVRKRVSVEAGSPVGWREYVGEDGVVHGVDSFGASGAYLDVFKKFGYTVETVVKIARSLLQCE
ncbi:hypothetical protein QJS10_CPB21g00359 [Acorus calamus]|uniref:transketolase n=1 Tax=Acorus calamus TaxID=4465 RepID=A0AAV9C4Q1_ACOCL|nr:hypothetical protein QJS10_CPB21g00359 [Acorus calamus]